MTDNETEGFTLTELNATMTGFPGQRSPDSDSDSACIVSKPCPKAHTKSVLSTTTSALLITRVRHTCVQVKAPS